MEVFIYRQRSHSKTVSDLATDATRHILPASQVWMMGKREQRVKPRK